MMMGMIFYLLWTLHFLEGVSLFGFWQKSISDMRSIVTTRTSSSENFSLCTILLMLYIKIVLHNGRVSKDIKQLKSQRNDLVNLKL